MNMDDESAAPELLRGTLELSYEVKRGMEAIRKAIRNGRIRATTVGKAHIFTREQWADAIAYYRDLDARREGKAGGERTP